MNSALATAMETGLPGPVLAALPGSSQEEIDDALAQSVYDQQDEIFDVLLPLARQEAFDYRALRTAADGNRRALHILLPAVSQRILGDTLVSVIPKAQDDILLAIIARLEPGPYFEGALVSACAHSSAAVVRALVPISAQDELQNALFIAAALRPEFSGSIASATIDVAAVIDRLLHPLQCDEDDKLPASSLSGADGLLPFVAADLRQAVIDKHPMLRECPCALAIMHSAALEKAIPVATGSSAPRM